MIVLMRSVFESGPERFHLTFKPYGSGLRAAGRKAAGQRMTKKWEEAGRVVQQFCDCDFQCVGNILKSTIKLIRVSV